MLTKYVKRVTHNTLSLPRPSPRRVHLSVIYFFSCSSVLIGTKGRVGGACPWRREPPCGPCSPAPNNNSHETHRTHQKVSFFSSLTTVLLAVLLRFLCTVFLVCDRLRRHLVPDFFLTEFCLPVPQNLHHFFWVFVDARSCWPELQRKIHPDSHISG